MKTAVGVQISSQTADDRRRGARQRVNLAAHADFANGALPLDCLVTQLSTTGARLELPIVIVSLQTLELAMPERNLKCRARVVWRRGKLGAW